MRTEPSSEPVAQTRAFWQDLGLPGLFDVHVHFLPPNIQRRVWRAVRRGRPEDRPRRGRSATAAATPSGSSCCARSACAASRRCPTPTGPGIAAYLNDWARDFAAEVPESPVVGDVLPRARGARRTSRELLADGVEIFKVHVQVGEFHLDDPLLDDGLGAARGRRARRSSCTPARGRSATTSPGPAPLRRVLARHPRLAVVVAHMGAPEYAEFLALAETLRAGPPGHHDGVHRLLRRRGAVPARAAAAAGRPAATRCCSAATSRPSPTPTPTSSRGSRALGLGEDWLRACAGTTACGCSVWAGGPRGSSAS